MKFYFSSLFVAVLLYLLVTVLVFIGLAIGYGWHIGSELYASLTAQGNEQLFSDTAITVTITVLLLPYLAAGYIAARIAHGAEYFNAAIAAVVLIGPFVFFYPPGSPLILVAYSAAAAVMLIGAAVAHWRRVRDTRRLAQYQQD
ncbi:MAG: hypothetical protein PVF75_04135 [Granulosicoccaceae bacterium]|jgi:hypothetical protein